MKHLFPLSAPDNRSASSHRRRSRIWLTAALAIALTGSLAPAAVSAEEESADQKLDRSAVLQLLSELHVSGTPRSALEGLSVPDMLELLKDPYTDYFTSEELSQFTDSLEQNYVGIGAVVGVDDVGVYIDRLIPGSPAESAGLQRDDYITAVDGNPVEGADTTGEVVKQILGPEGTKVSVTVKRGDVTKEFSLTRQKIQLPPVNAELFQPEVGYIQVTEFSSDAGTKFAAKLDELLKQGAKSFIIDVRDNPGGLLSSAKTIVEQFVDSGVLIHTKDRNGVDEPVTLQGRKLAVPVTILVNERSASASEVITGALRDYQIAAVVGTKTFGKGSVQQIYNLPSGGALKVTVQEYLTPKMTKVNHIGITPDIVVEGETAQLLAALRKAGLSELSIKDDKHRMFVNGVDIGDDMQVIREQGHVYAPTRTVTSLLAGTVTWNGETRSVDIAAGGKTGQYSESSHQLVLRDGSSFIDLESLRSTFSELSYTDTNGTLTLSAKAKAQ
ncbi:S41 family peptidase [Paenibacillus chartarius]|uniref:S41 family peptidase n=1 Tax=Paenibacillus chartarius TaxID=747481 RepID=A0ABV6DQ88_9BACL